MSEDVGTPSPNSPFYRRPTLSLLLGLVILLIDQWTKWLIQTRMPLNTVLVPIESWYPYFQFTYIANTGTVFGPFPDASWLFTLLAIVVSITLIVLMYKTPTDSILFRLAVGLLFGGAMGNLLDRLRIGFVVDFIDIDVSSVVNLPFADWAVFNVADMALISGIILLSLHMLLEPEEMTDDGATAVGDASEPSSETPDWLEEMS